MKNKKLPVLIFFLIMYSFIKMQITVNVIKSTV